MYIYIYIHCESILQSFWLKSENPSRCVNHANGRYWISFCWRSLLVPKQGSLWVRRASTNTPWARVGFLPFVNPRAILSTPEQLINYFPPPQQLEKSRLSDSDIWKW